VAVLLFFYFWEISSNVSGLAVGRRELYVYFGAKLVHPEGTVFSVA
jgi:hypothetical protein